MLRIVGFWHLTGERDGFFHPCCFVDKNWCATERPLICQYLRLGKRDAEYLGYSGCRFLCGIPDYALGCADFTDGKWLWPEGLAHYVEKHCVKLPDEFIEDMRSNKFVVPSNLGSLSKEWDITYWKDWCSANATGWTIGRWLSRTGKFESFIMDKLCTLKQ